ncbi:MAG TPA: NlpC/P60 family protein, partial [Desulfobacterales bacterium]|nr:NlpC/P60 family protein [Desulfobacterales bacterium]
EAVVSAVPTAQPIVAPVTAAPDPGGLHAGGETASVLSATLAPTLDASPSVRIEEDHPFLVYAGRWRAGSGTAASSGGYRYSSAAESTLRIEFTGSAVSLIGPVGPTYGTFEVWLDDVHVDTVSQYAPRYAHQQVLWELSGLSDGAYTLVIRVTGTHEPGSAGAFVIVDAFEVAGEVTRAEPWPPQGRVAFEESDPRTFREGRWTRTRTSAASGGAVMHTGVVGSLFTVHFSGTRIAWIGPRAPGYGRAEVFVDGVRRATVSQYASAVSHRQVIWSVDGLGPGGHTLTIRVLGTRDAASAGTVIAVDGFVADELLVPGFEEHDRRIQRRGSWIRGTSTLASGGGYIYSRRADAYVVVPFWGSSFRLVGMRGPAFGMAEVHLDGRLVGTVDLFAPEVQRAQTIWSVSGLSDGYHAVVIRVLGRASPESAGTTVVLDRFEFQGAGARPGEWAPGVVRIEDADGRLTGAGGWSAGSAAAASGGAYRYASRPGSSITVTFIGTSVAWIGPTGPTYGQAAVFLNGVRVATVSQYAPDFAHRRVVWSLSGLPDRAHTLTVRATGTREAASTGTALVVDGFDVTGERATPRGLVVALARQQLGKQYVWAAEGPDTFDCSGLVVYVFRNAIGVSVPRTSRQQWAATSPRFSSFEPLLPADLCFSTSPANIHHVGLYAGFGLSIHAPSRGRFVEFRTAHTYGCFGRLSPSVWPMHRRG